MELRRVIFTAGLSLLFQAAACGGGGGSTGTTGAPATTTGAPLDAGAPCSSNGECQSGVCGVDGDDGGAGNCCLDKCVTGDSCGATGCNDTGACVYPASGTSCGADFCGAARLTQRACNGAGACVPTNATPCPGDLGCNDAGTACNTSCSTSKDCAGGYVCNAGACVSPVHVGPCTEDDDCWSNVCGLNGTGHCCYASTRCSTADATCGATDCDPGTGACNYADAGTSCGSVVASCANGMQQDPSVCDGKGACPTPATRPCDPFLCGPTACLTSCTDATSCGAGDFCDSVASTCCPGTISGGTVRVDATGGNDAAGCCSLPGYPPCQTIARTMQIIDTLQARDVIISAVVDKGHTWNPPGEVYPIVLGWGVELKAPEVYFYDANANTAIFDIKAFSANDTVGYASLVGSALFPVSVGVDEFRDQTTDASAIQVEPGSTLYLANASVNGSETKDTAAITVTAGGTLVLAQDKSAAVTGTVTIGNALNNTSTNGYKGIVCQTGKGMGCTIRDAALKAGQSSLVIEGQQYIDIDAEDYANITLTSSPVIGLPPAATGFEQCMIAASTAKPDVESNGTTNAAAVLLNGLATVTFDNGTVQCIHGGAFFLAATTTGVPNLTLDSTTIQNTEFGVKANAGSATVSNSTIQYNYIGVEQGTDGTNVASIDLSSGGDGGTTTVACSSYVETAKGRNGAGASVVNATSAVLNAQNVDWDTSGPDLFQCNSGLSTCTCENSSCSVSVADAGFDGLDAVYTSTGSIETGGNGVSSLDCTPPASTCTCPPPLVCCGPNVCCG